MGASLRRRSLQNQERLEESEALQPVAGHPDTSSGALGSLCRQFQRRLPLRAVSLTLGVGPSTKRLGTPEPGRQGLQAAAHSAKGTLGAMSQRTQESCQSGPRWLVETQVKARRRKRGAQKGSSPLARSLSQWSTQLSVAAPAPATRDPWEKEYHRLSAQMGPVPTLGDGPGGRLPSGAPTPQQSPSAPLASLTVTWSPWGQESGISRRCPKS